MELATVKKFICSKCRNVVYIENIQCVRCGASLGFEPHLQQMVAVEPIADGIFRKVGDRGRQTWRFCGNADHGVCNWLRPGKEIGLCRACELNRKIPNLNEPGSIAVWSELERAKKRLVYSLLRFGLPLDGGETGKGSLTFDFTRDATGHLDGVITIDVAEVDAVERERQRQHFDERYRSLLGHLRHESGHYYWMLLIEGSRRLNEYRRLFGDERQDYQSALSNHHATGPPADWQARHVSAYASSHPWEDWAETWAHYLHMTDAVDTAEAEGLEPHATGFVGGKIWPFKANDVYSSETFEVLMKRWVPLTLALNSLNRSMGHNDFYPFVLSPTATAKLAFVHRVVRASHV
jgi:hypothetical protein